MSSIQANLESAKIQLIQAGLVDSPQIDAELLLSNILQKNRTYLFTWPEKELTQEQQQAFKLSLNKRLQGHPIAHILGQREFWGLDLSITPDTLIPRPDTETLIEVTLELTNAHQGKKDYAILDLGTGSGAIALALKSELPESSITAVDQSIAALNIAKQNASNNKLKVHYLQSNWFSAVELQTFHFIVSNPPYIEKNDPHLQQGDVRFEPLSALTSGDDGLEDIRIIINQAWSYLQPQGWLIIEHGYNQAKAIQALFKTDKYTNIQTRNDLGGNPRISFAQKQ